MAPPEDRVFDGKQHPTDALLVCQGHQIQSSSEVRVYTINIWAKRDRGDGDKLYFCIELYQPGRDDLRGEHKWLPEAEYMHAHQHLFTTFDMDANFDFDVDGGLRDKNGVVRNGWNRLVERGGALKMQAIRENCP